MILEIENKWRDLFAQALDELGLTEKFLLSLAEQISNNKFEIQTFYRTIDVNSLLQICQILHLDINMLKDGYDQRSHRYNIALASVDNSSNLPSTMEAEDIEQKYYNSPNSSPLAYIDLD